jgi:RNA polymerase sigma-70 factor (ECF subfamily)
MDYTILQKAQQGDKNAYKGIVSYYKSDVYRFCYSLLREPEASKDLAQETFITAYGKMSLYKPTGSFKAWLCRIAYHQFLNIREKQKRRNEYFSAIEEELEFLATINSEQQEKPQDTEGIIKQAMENISEDYRLCLSMKYLNNMSLQQIAETLNLPLGTVKVRIFRGKSLFGKAIRKIREMHYEL